MLGTRVWGAAAGGQVVHGRGPSVLAGIPDRANPPRPLDPLPPTVPLTRLLQTTPNASCRVERAERLAHGPTSPYDASGPPLHKRERYAEGSAPTTAGPGRASRTPGGEGQLPERRFRRAPAAGTVLPSAGCA